MMFARSIKTPAELDLLRRATRLNEMAIRKTIASWEKGATWRDLNIAYARSVAELGGFVRDPGGMVWGHPRGTEQTIMLSTGFEDSEVEAGTHVMFDCHGTIDLYCWDGGKTWVVDGEPEGDAKRWAKATTAVAETLVAAMKPGARIDDLQALARATYRKAGVPDPDRALIFFHGLGLSHMELELMTADGKAHGGNWVLEEGMVAPDPLALSGRPVRSLLVRGSRRDRQRRRQAAVLVGLRSDHREVEHATEAGGAFMRIGVSMFVTDYTITPGELGQAVEERGFELLWMPEHTHIPTSRKSPWPGGPNLPDVYKQTLDPFMALTAAAVVTKRIKLATGICLVVERDPIHTAKNVATLDYLSGGRFVFGVGGGWNAEEMANHGTVFKTRFVLMRERIEAMKVIWANDVAEYHGEHVKFEPLWAWPKPVQKPHPPILIGGEFPHGAKRAIAFGDGWMPIGGRGLDVLEILPRYRQMAAEAGRNPDDVPMSVFAARQDADQLKRYADAGVDRAVFLLPTGARDAVSENPGRQRSACAPSGMMCSIALSQRRSRMCFCS